MLKCCCFLTALMVAVLGCAGVGSEERKGESEATAADKADSAYIRNWLVCGPFPGRTLAAEERDRIAATGYRFAGRLRGGHLVDYLKAMGGEAAARPTEGSTVKCSDGTSLKWKKHTSASDTVRLEDVLGVPYSESWPYHFVVMYGYTTIQSPTGGPTFLEIGTDDSGKVYLNGRLVHNAHVLHCTTNRDFVPIELKKRENALLVKMENCGGPSGFIARIVNDPPRKLAELSRDEEVFEEKHDCMSSLLTKRGYEWASTETPKGDALIYSVYPRHYEEAQRALLEAIKAGEVQATPIE